MGDLLRLSFSPYTPPQHTETQTRLTVTERVSVCTVWTGVLRAMDDEQLAILLYITVVTRVLKLVRLVTSLN